MGSDRGGAVLTVGRLEEWESGGLDLPMNKKTFQTLLANFSLQTLAQIIVDLEQAQEEWAYYSDAAPAAEMQQALMALLPTIHARGQTLAAQEGQDFARMIEQVRAEREDNGWATTRDEQEVENWLSDFD